MMRHPLKLRIMKKIEYSQNWKRFIEQEKILVDDLSPIKSEAQLCNYIYSKFGEGRYMVLAWQKGVEGFWVFWIGFLRENGFIRDIGKNKDLDAAKADLQKANRAGADYEERQLIQEEIDMEREYSDSAPKTRRGPIGIIKARPGQLHSYEDL